ncbi:hypothetical protein EGT49_12180 [Companilactobacillus suantsaicola]|uniref:Phospholipase C/D domain-containing protein n=1 Tax=Companilactobacillus suantsaicola TaxID=2487723 RepID=A0A4Z0JGB1_9LACO|nr:hypothetical protein [Companilactobacillus suantsaicola]TGD20981.1 hypothetical protein EGT49_12180 [Companilactobacillus suantsaicola]
MGSRIMHYAMGTVLCRKYSFDNDFLVGSIAPDVNKNSHTPKKLTHFIHSQKGTNTIVPQDFIDEYSWAMTDFQLGYYLHLVSDDVWLNTVFDKYIRKNTSYPKEELQRIYYHDFEILNKILIDKYNLKKLSFDKYMVSNVKEIQDKDLEYLVDDLNNDFDEQVTGDLQLFKVAEIYQYIDDSAAKFEDLYFPF